MSEWIEEATSGLVREERIIRKDARGEEKEIAWGYEILREQQNSCPSAGRRTERVLLIRSLSYAESKKRGLDKRWQTAISKLMALTPPVGRGKKHITSELELRERAELILTDRGVKGLLNYDYDYEVPTRYRKGRYQMLEVTPDYDAIAQGDVVELGHNYLKSLSRIETRKTNRLRKKRKSVQVTITLNLFQGLKPLMYGTASLATTGSQLP